MHRSDMTIWLVRGGSGTPHYIAQKCEYLGLNLVNVLQMKGPFIPPHPPFCPKKQSVLWT